MRSDTEQRACKCGCGPFTPDRANQLYRVPACRTRAYRVRRAERASRRHQSVTRTQRKTRYALVEVNGATIGVLGFDLATSKRAVERAFGISDRPDLAAIAERHLPAVV